MCIFFPTGAWRHRSSAWSAVRQCGCVSLAKPWTNGLDAAAAGNNGEGTVVLGITALYNAARAQVCNMNITIFISIYIYIYYIYIDTYI